MRVPYRWLRNFSSEHEFEFTAMGLMPGTGQNLILDRISSTYNEKFFPNLEQITEYMYQLRSREM
jgi:hypothetical protein